MIIKRKISIVNILIAVIIILNAGSHFLYNVCGVGSIYYASYIGWILLLLSIFIFGNVRIKKNGIYVFSLLILVFAIGAFSGESIINHGISDIHVGVFTAIAYLCLYGVDFKKVHFDIDYRFICKIVLIIGILSVFYAIVFQQSYMIELIKRNNVSWNSWLFVSFFRQRNIFGQYCYIASICALLLYTEKKNKVYIIALVLFGGIIILTNSRAALIGYVLLIGLYICLKSKNKYLFFMLSVIVLLLFVYAFDLFGHISTIFYHEASNGNDSGAIRVLMWRDCIKFLFQQNAFMFGLGMGAESIFLMPKYGVGSSHSVYVDAIFDGGIVFLVVIFLSLYRTMKTVLKIKQSELKNLYVAAIISFILYGFLEAGMALFGSNYFSITASILLIVLPQFIQRKESRYE